MLVKLIIRRSPTSPSQCYDVHLSFDEKYDSTLVGKGVEIIFFGLLESYNKLLRKTHETADCFYVLQYNHTPQNCLCFQQLVVDNIYIRHNMS
jgi:hypothetical protein